MLDLCFTGEGRGGKGRAGQGRAREAGEGRGGEGRGGEGRRGQGRQRRAGVPHALLAARAARRLPASLVLSSAVGLLSHLMPACFGLSLVTQAF